MNKDTVIRVQGQTIVILAALIIVASVAFGAGYVVATSNSARNIPNMNVFQEAWNLANNQFYYPKPDQKDEMYGAINGMLSTFKDPFTLLIPPEAAAANTQLMEGATGGIGAKIGQDQDGQL